MESIFVEESDPHVNPLGVKGVGEIAIVGAASAIVNAIYHATGKRIRELPVTPDKLL
jgi:xanthine dehydrogenase YagR molybdenum-binding subunit